MLKSCVFCFVALISCVSAVRYVPFTPCPKLFNYFESQTFEVFGAMTFENDLSGSYDLEVNMSIPLDTDKNIHITRTTEEYKIQNGERIEYYVHFPYNHTFPKLTSIALNGRVYCVGPPEVATAEHGVTPLSTKYFFTTKIVDGLKPKSTPAPAPAPFIQIVINNHPQCGINIDYKPLIFLGDSTRSGEYPWLVAIFAVHTSGSYTFICGGSLISTRHVLTAAHCTRDSVGTNVSAEDFVVVLGKHNIKNWALGSTIRGVKEYYVHPEYNKPADADMAMLVLDKPVGFSVTIKPICLWDENDDLSEVVDKMGTIAGWGKDESGRNYVDEPRQVQMPIVSQEICLRSDPRFGKLTSTRTFCAGQIGGNKGPCSGDSGSGLVMKRGETWKLRGIVSIALLDPVTVCDVNNYIVFTDVPKYSTWIQKTMDTL